MHARVVAQPQGAATLRRFQTRAPTNPRSVARRRKRRRTARIEIVVHLSQKVDRRCVQCGSLEKTRAYALTLLAKQKRRLSQSAASNNISRARRESRFACTKRPRPPKAQLSLLDSVGHSGSHNLDRARIKRLGHDEVFAKLLVGHERGERLGGRELHFFGDARRAGLEGALENTG